MPNHLPKPASRSDWLPNVFAGILGFFLALGLWKLGNPIIFDRVTDRPQDVIQLYIWTWPPSWGFFLIVPVALLGLVVAHFKTGAPAWLVWLPLIWLGWQFLAAMQTVDSRLTGITMPQLVFCAVCYFLGLLALNRSRNLIGFWIGLTAGLILTLWIGFGQHYGGLEETRRYFEMYVPADSPRRQDAEFMKRLHSDRIFSTLVYPNAFAGTIILLLPVAAVSVWCWSANLPRVARRVITGVLIYASLACLYWTGSKSGWLIALVLVTVALLHLPFPRKWKSAVVTAVLVLGLAGFGYKFAGYFGKGATSVVARFDCWQAAVYEACQSPVLGSGPGTFGVIYKAVKPPEAEMAQLAHNDYLEQASDSGWVGFLAFSGWIFGSLWVVYRKSALKGDVTRFAVWLGLLGWALQSMVEFTLYIPGIAWLAFVLLGWLAAGVNRVTTGGNGIDKRAVPR